MNQAAVIAEQAIDTVLDVGANEGLFARRLRDEGFRCSLSDPARARLGEA